MQKMLLPVLAVATLATTACGPPTREEIAQAEQTRREQIEYCSDLIQEMERNNDRPLIRAAIQETYNNDCLGRTYPTPGGGDG